MSGAGWARRGAAAMGLILLIAGLVPLLAAPASAVGTFTDDDGSPHEPNIEFIAARGITGGCSQQNPNLYCPGNPVTRAQMASFIVRALNLPAASHDFFSDDNGSPHEDNINRLAEAGITGGCSSQDPNVYCPSDGVTRAQMATFIKRAWNVPATGSDFFTDDNNSSHQPNINAIRAVNITGGCSVQNPNLYCPGQVVNRAQMASFLTRAIQWATGGSTTTTTGATTTSTTQPQADDYELRVSNNANRTSSAMLSGATLSGNRYVFVPQAQSNPAITQVRFWVDDASKAGAPYRVENLQLFDLEATAAGGNANPFDTFKLTNGSHRIDVEIDRDGASSLNMSAQFTVSNAPGLLLNKYVETFKLQPGNTSGADKTVTVLTNDGSGANWTAAKSGGSPADTSWLTITDNSGTAGQTVSFAASAVGLSPGVRRAFVTVSAAGHQSATFTVILTVLPTGGVCPSLGSDSVDVGSSYTLNFSTADSGSVQDADGQGTGFKCVLATTNGAGYVGENLNFDDNANILTIGTTAGLFDSNVDTQDNALGVGWATGNDSIDLTVDLVNPTTGSAGFEQAGLWFGINEDNYVKAVVVNGTGATSGTRIQLLVESGGASAAVVNSGNVGSLSSSTIELHLHLDASDLQATASYQIEGGLTVNLGPVAVPAGFFAGANHDANAGTANLQLGGVFTSHRNGPNQLFYTFDNFALSAS